MFRNQIKDSSVLSRISLTWIYYQKNIWCVTVNDILQELVLKNIFFFLIFTASWYLISNLNQQLQTLTFENNILKLKPQKMCVFQFSISTNVL